MITLTYEHDSSGCSLSVHMKQFNAVFNLESVARRALSQKQKNILVLRVFRSKLKAPEKSNR